MAAGHTRRTISPRRKSDNRSTPDVTNFYNNAGGEDLSDYGVIFEESGSMTCADAAASAL